MRALSKMAEKDSDSSKDSSMSDDSDQADHDTSSSSSDESATPLTCTRKRVRREQCWVKWWKKLRNAGKMYVNSKGVVVPPRVSGYDCKCPMHCFKNVSQSDRSAILDEFNHLQTFDVQNATCMVSFIDLVLNDDIPSSRGAVVNKRARFHTSWQEVKVCLKAFCGVHGISVKRVRNVRVKDCTPRPHLIKGERIIRGLIAYQK